MPSTTASRSSTKSVITACPGPHRVLHDKDEAVLVELPYALGLVGGKARLGAEQALYRRRASS